MAAGSSCEGEPLSKPGKVDERLWERAKKLAAKQGKDGNYAYIQGIYQKMTDTKKSFTVSKELAVQAVKEEVEMRKSENPIFDEILGRDVESSLKKGYFSILLPADEAKVGDRTKDPDEELLDAMQQEVDMDLHVRDTRKSEKADEKSKKGVPAMVGPEVPTMTRGNMKDSVSKAQNGLQEGEVSSGAELGQNDTLTDGPSGGTSGRFSGESKSGMPNAAGENGADQFSDDDRKDAAQMSDHKKPLEQSTDMQGSPDLDRSANQEMSKAEFVRGEARHQAAWERQLKKSDQDVVYPTGIPAQPSESVPQTQVTYGRYGYAVYTDTTDQAIAKAQNDQGYIVPEPTLGIPDAPLTASKCCGLCKSAMPEFLTTCPDCGAEEGRAVQGGLGSVVMQKSVADSIRPRKQKDLYIPFGVVVNSESD